MTKKTDGRIHIESMLKGESLQREDVLANTSGLDVPILPAVHLYVALGCVWDAGPFEVRMAADRILSARSASVRPVVAVSDGERSRHVARIATDIGIPTGGIAQLIASCEEMNATVMAALLAPYGVWLPRDHIWDIGFLTEQRMIPIILAVPPYSLWEPPADGGLPEHGSIFGANRLRDGLNVGGGVTLLHAFTCGGGCADAELADEMSGWPSRA